MDGKIDEHFPKQPHTKKGKIRFKQEQIIKQSGVPNLIAHIPDFYGPYAENSLLHETFQRVILNQKTIFVGNPKILREYIYTLDGAHALVELSLRDHTYGRNWNIYGVGVITGNEILHILRRRGYSKRMTTISKFMVQIGGFFNKMLKEYAEMYYLNESPVILSGEKLKMELGDIRQTSYEVGIMNTLDQMKPFREFSWKGVFLLNNDNLTQIVQLLENMNGKIDILEKRSRPKILWRNFWIGFGVVSAIWILFLAILQIIGYHIF